MKDSQGLEVTCKDAEALRAIDASIVILFRQQAGIEQWLPVMADTYPHCPMLQVYAAVAIFMSFSKQVIDSCLSTYLLRLTSSTLNERENYHYMALQKLTTLDFYQVIHQYQLLLESYPQDKVALLMLENCAFLAGKMQPLLDTYQMVDSHYKNDPDFLSMQAFLYAHIHHYDEAKALIDKSLTYAPHNAWTQHVYIHTINENNLAEVETAIDFLEHRSKGWSKQNRFFEGHNWMHLCLLYLSRDRLQKNSSNKTAALIIDSYTKHIWGEAKSYNFEQNNAFLVLWHLELAGHTKQIPEELWQDLANHAESFIDDYFTPYLTVTAILAVAKVASAKANTALAQFTAYAASYPLSSEKYHAWYEIGLPILEGCLAFLKKDYASAVRLLAPVHDKTRPMGHSDEQRAIFTATYALAKRLS